MDTYLAIGFLASLHIMLSLVFSGVFRLEPRGCGTTLGALFGVCLLWAVAVLAWPLFYFLVVCKVVNCVLFPEGRSHKADAAIVRGAFLALGVLLSSILLLFVFALLLFAFAGIVAEIVRVVVGAR